MLYIEKPIAALLFLLLPLPGFSQFLVNNGNIITVTNNAKLTVVGGVQNEGTIRNEGEISITENWQNVESYLTTNGTMVFNGVGSQLINHNNQSIYSMAIAGGGEKLLESNLDILPGGNISFNSGIVRLTESTLFTLQEDVSVDGGSVNSYVEGALYHRGNGFKFFPIGKNGQYRPATLTDVEGNNPHVGMEVFEGNWNPQRNYDLDEISTTRYWRLYHITPTTDFHGSPIALSVGNDEPFQTIDVLVVSQADSLGGVFRGLGQASVEGDLNAGRVTSENLATKPILAIAKSSTITLNRLLYVPNAFSPKSYNQEERGIRVYGQEVSEDEFEFKIFDRWGKVFYSTNSFLEANENGWRLAETINLKGLKSFKYTLKGKFTNGIPFSRLGSIRLIK